MFKSIFKKPSREDLITKKADNVFTELTKSLETEFTDLETVQILNSVRRKTVEWLEIKKSEAMEQSVNANQKAVEIAKAIEFVE